MSISKVRLPNNTEEDIKAKYLIQSSSSDATSAEFSARTVTEDAIANIQKIYGNTVVVSNNLVSNSATAILSRGFNQWDGSAIEGSFVDNVDGAEYTAPNSSHTDYIPIVPGTSYYIRTSKTSGQWMAFYDENKNFVSGATGYNASKTAPNNARYMRCTIRYNSDKILNDFCISISDPAKNGTYEPYNGHQIDLNIPTLTGKLNGTGSSVVIFPDGMKKAGTVYDEIVGNKAIKRVGSVDMGTLSWTYQTTGLGTNDGTTPFFRTRRSEMTGGTTNIICAQYSVSYSGDKRLITTQWYVTNEINVYDSSYTTAPSFTTAMSGVMLYYELATPQEYILDNALQLQYPVVAGGTEMVLPTTGTASMKIDVIYGNAADATSNLSSNFISVDSMKVFLNNLGTQMGGTWNMQYNNGKFEFTFSSS